MKKKIISTILALSGLFILGFATLTFLGVFKEQQAGILIEADPVSTVYINNQEVGKTPYESTRQAEELMIRIKPDLIQNVTLDDYETKINLVPGIQTIIQRTFRETEEVSSGALVSFEKIGGSESYVTVVSIPDNSQVRIDNKVHGYTPLRVKVPAGDHTLVVVADNYLEKSLPIRVYAGYKLTASVKLARNIAKTSEEVIVIESSAVLPKIKINKTDIGFLRVRSGASTGFPEVAQVKPDEEYEILEEGENGSWYKIKIGETEGWVSAEFVTPI